MWPVASPPSRRCSAAEPALILFDMGGVLLGNGCDRIARMEAAREFDLD
jgi:hypothetical protein